MTTALTPTATHPQRRSRRRTEVGQGAEGGGRRLFEPSRTRGVDATPIPTVPRRAALTALTAAVASSRDLSPATASRRVDVGGCP